MKKKILAFFSAFFVLINCQAQYFNWVDASASTTGGCIIKDVYVNATADIYTVGTFSGDVYLGGSLFTAAGTSDLFVQKRLADGTIDWTKQFGGAGASFEGLAVVVDNANNVYITGVFTGNIDLNPGTTGGEIAASGTSGGDVSIFKLDPSGNYIWDQQGTANSSVATPTDMTIDGLGNILVTGGFDGTLVFGGISKVSAAEDIFLVKLSAGTGSVSNFFNYGGLGNDRAEAVTTRSNNNIILGGSFEQIATFPNSVTLTALGTAADGFLVEIGAGFTFTAFAGRIGNASFDETITGLGVDASNNIYATGTHEGTSDLDPTAGGTFDLNSPNGTSAFILKFNSGLTLDWAQQIESAQTGDLSVANAIAVTPIGDAYIAGYFSGDISAGLSTVSSVDPSIGESYIAKISSAGNFLWLRHFSGGEGAVNAIAQRDGSCYTVGTFDDQVDFNPSIHPADTFFINPYSGFAESYLCHLTPVLLNNPDMEALQRIKASIFAFNGIDTLLSNIAVLPWVGTVPNNWYGVNVDLGSGRVIGLNLSGLQSNLGYSINNSVTRALPDSIFTNDRFGRLQHIDLSACGYTAAPNTAWFDTATTQNTELKTIHLNLNEFGKSGNVANFVTKTAGNFPNLDLVSANSCIFDPFVSNLPITAILEEASGSEFAQIFADTLLLSNNQLIGVVPRIDTLFPNLLHAELYLNQLSNFDFFPSSTLEHLEIYSNKFLDASLYGMLLDNCPDLQYFAAQGSIDIANATNFTFDSESLSTPHDFTKVDMSGNNLVHPAGSFLNMDYFLNTNALDQDYNFSFNLFDSIQITELGAGDFYSVRFFNIANNLFDQPLPAAIFNSFSDLVGLDISNNLFTDEFPQPKNTTYDFAILESLNVGNNQLSGAIPLDWMFDWADPQIPMPLIEMYFHNNQFSTVRPLTTLDASFSYLYQIWVENNELDFHDLGVLVKDLDMIGQENTGLGIEWYYAPAVAELIDMDGGTTYMPDTLAFKYFPQDSVGIGGVRHREPNSSIKVEEIVGRTAVQYSEYIWMREDVSGNTEYLGYAKADTSGFLAVDSSGLVANMPAIYQTGLSDFSGVVNTHVLEDLSGEADRESVCFRIDESSAVYGDWNTEWYYYNKIYNDSFPNLVLTSYPKRIIVDFCYDTAGQQVQCQTVFVQYNGNYSAAKSGVILTEEERQALRDEIGVLVVNSCPCGDLETWEVSDSTYEAYLQSNGSGTRNVATANSGKPGLLSANANYRISSVYTPRQAPQNAPTGNTTNTAAVKVAIIDSGVDYDHPLLAAHIVPPTSHSNDSCAINEIGYNFTDPLELPYDEYGHGTHVAGVLAGEASTTNNMMIDANNDQLALMPFKYTDAQGGGTLFNAVCAMYMAIENGTDVINASWGFYGDKSEGLEDAMRYAESRDIMVVCAAGNNGTDNINDNLEWPSAFSLDSFDINNIIAVASLDPNNSEELAAYSNYNNVVVHLATEGLVNSTAIDTVGNVPLMGDEEGTSFATPKVSRAVALLRYLYPNASYCEIKEALRLGVDTMLSVDADKLRWKGRLNYQKSLDLLDSLGTFPACIVSGEIPIPNTPSASSLRVYPNPFGSAINLEWTSLGTSNEPTDIRIYSVDGRLQYQFFSNQISETIATNTWQAGFYILQAKRGGKIYTQKIIKQ